MIIDAHQHFWRFDPEQFGWVSDEMKAIRRDFLPGDLKLEIESVGVDAAIAVQARQSIAETEWLLELADRHAFVRGVVGWVPLARPNLSEYLERLASHVALVGVRHIVHDEPDDEYLLGNEFNAGIALLERFQLTYDILIFERHLPYAIDFVDRHPKQTFVVDHLAKPCIRAREIEPWRTNMRRLAERSNVRCKVSGMVTEADLAAWTVDDLRPYWDEVLNSFGPHRLLFGSDWPVCKLATEYGRWYEIVRELVTPLSDSEQARILGGTAIDVYGLAV